MPYIKTIVCDNSKIGFWEINESMSKNFNALYDEDNDTPDWVEIYNKADTSINVENYSLSDDVNELDKW